MALTLLVLCAGLFALGGSPAPTDDPMKSLPCVFSVKPTDFGLQIELINSTGSFDVHISEPNKNGYQTKRTFTDSTHNIVGLKPYTAYEVTLKRTGGVDCTNRDNIASVTITTDSMKKFVNLMNLTPTVLYFNNAIKNGHPPQIDLPLPDQCNLTVHYTCGESKTLSEVEPFEVYNCIGNIKMEDKIITRTNPVRVNTFCDLDVSISRSSSTDTSISLEWNTETENCNITLLRPKLDYKCSCSQVNPMRRWHSGPYVDASLQKCDVKGLTAFTEYKCNVYTIYNDKPVPTKMQNLRKRTDAGVPDGVGQLTVNITENNVLTVTCKEPKDFRGGSKKYEATLYLEDETVEKKLVKDKCHFEFRNLGYSTYRVEVRAFNGKLHSAPSFKTVNTLFNDMALIGVLVYLILIITVLVVLYKLYVQRRCRSQSEPSVIYANDGFSRNC